MIAHTVFSHMQAELRRLPVSDLRGRVQALSGLELLAAGLGAEARLGAHVEVAGRIRGEIVAVNRGAASVLPFGTWNGVALSDEVRLLSADGTLFPDPSWVGRVLDAFGCPLDGAVLQEGAKAYPARSAPPDAYRRRPTGRKLESGIKAMDVFVPICRGQRLGVFAGSGVGKSTLMAMFARQMDADVIVIGLVGERGREVQDFITRDLGPEGLARTVLVVATSDQPPLTRRQAAWTATAIAEYLRDQGKQVLLMIDSVTRFAMAQREIGLSAGEPPTTRAFWNGRGRGRPRRGRATSPPSIPCWWTEMTTTSLSPTPSAAFWMATSSLTGGLPKVGAIRQSILRNPFPARCRTATCRLNARS